MLRRAVRYSIAPIALVLAACAAHDDSSPAPPDPEPRGAGTPATTLADAPPIAALSEARMLGVVHALNAASGDLARQAAARAKDNRVKLHAMVVGADAANVDSALRRVSPSTEESPMSRGIALDAHLRQLALEPRADGDFDRAYVDTEVQLDAAALGLLDALSMGNVLEPAVASALADLRGHVVDHLRDALRIQDALE